MARIHIITGLILLTTTKRKSGQCLAFVSPPFLSKLHLPGACNQSSSTETSTSADNDSSYESLRRKFGLSSNPINEESSDGSDSVHTDFDQEEIVPRLSESEVASQAAVSVSPSTEIDKYPAAEPVALRTELDLVELTPPEKSEEELAQTDPRRQTSFSMTFPRYNVPFTTFGDSKTKDEIKKEIDKRKERRLDRGVITRLKSTPIANESWLLSGLFKRAESVLSTTPSLKLDPDIEKAYADGPFRWVTSESVEGDLNNTERCLLDEDFVAAGAFWRMAADISQIGNTHKQEEKHQQWYLAMPETTFAVAQNLCDIMNWYADYLEEENDTYNKDSEIDEQMSSTRGKATTIIRARIDTCNSKAIPIVEFTANYHSPGSLPLSSSEINAQQKQSTNEDTERRTKSWVKRLLVGLGVCPFTKSNVKSGQGLGDKGVPVANIMYRHSGASFVDHGKSGEMYTLMAGKLIKWLCSRFNALKLTIVCSLLQIHGRQLET